MKLLIILFLAVVAIGLFLGYVDLKQLKRIKKLREERNELLQTIAAESNLLRVKGKEIDELKKELDKYSEVEIKVALSLHEKKMILHALEMPHYADIIRNPVTRYFIRDVYKKLKEKIKKTIKEA